MIVISANKVFSEIIKTCFTGIFVFILLMPVVYAHIPTAPPLLPDFSPTPPCGKFQCCTKDGSGNKIVYRSGEETFRVADMRVNGVYPINIVRTYSSNTIFDSRLGYGWAFGFDKRLFEYPDNSIRIRRGCGNLNRYLLVAGSYQPDSGSQNNKLQKNADNTFTVTYYNGEKDHYDTQGRLTSSVDIRGNSLEFSYDARGKMPLIGSSPNTLDPSKPFIVAYMPRLTRIQIKHAGGTLGNSVDFAYNDNTGRITSITANDGRVVSYQHDIVATTQTRGNLTGVTGLEGKVSIYKYEDKNGTVFQDYHNITHIQEGLNTTPVLLTYNAKDQAIMEVIGNQILNFDFSLLPFQTTVTETQSDDQNLNIQLAVSVYQFDLIGFTNFKRDALGNETKYTLDNFGNKLKEEIYNGAVLPANLVKTIDRTFDVNSNTLTEATTLASGEIITTTWIYDGTQKSSETTVSSLTPSKIFKTEWVYNRDTGGNASTVQEEKRYKDDGTFLSTSYTYNSNGDVLTTTLPDGHIIENEYAPVYGGRYITKTYHRIAGAAVTDLQQTYTYDNKGNRTTVTDALSRTTTTVYDDLNRRTKVTNHLGHVTSYIYDDRSNLINIIRDRTVANDQLDNIKLTYDGRNQLVQIERSDASGALVVINQNTYDSSGQLYSITNSIGQTNTFSYDLLHRLNGITNYKNESIGYTLDVLGNRTREEVKNSSNVIVRSSDATFDALNRQLMQIGATNGQTQTYTYDAVGNRVTSIDALARPTTQYTYDTLSRLTNVQDANAKNTVYNYYDRGWLQTVTDPLGLVTTYNYNELGRLDNLISPDTGTTIYTYDLAGNNETKKDARNITVTYSYDGINRLTDIIYPDTTKNVNFTYDQNTFGLGKLTSISDESGSTQYEYNHWGDLIKETRVIGGQSFITQYVYDTEHRQVGIIYPSGRVITLTPDINNELASISSNYQTSIQALLSNIVYMPFGGIDTASYGNGLILNQDYDLDYRITLKQVGTVYDRTINYNDVNNITTITNNLDATRNQTFNYDDLDRLTNAASTGSYGSQQFEYDADGNRTLETKNGTLTSNYNYPTSSNKLNAITGNDANSFSYDNNGNTQTKSGITFNFDDTNRMSQAINGSVTANYKYDGKGQRVVKDVNGVVTIFIFDKDGKLIAEADGAGQTQREYIYFSGQPVALAKYGTGSGVYYYHTNHLGTPQILTDQSQAVVWSGDYQPFGKVNITTSTVENLLRQPGQFEDLETGLYQNYFREYDPSLGRYTQSDPIGLRGGLNTYVYVKANPILYIDILGLDTCKYIIRRRYTQTTRELVKPEVLGVAEVCAPIMGPSVTTPMPGPRPTRIPFPVGPTMIDIQCQEFTIVLKEAVYKDTSVAMTSGYMKCTDDCGNVTETNYMSDRRADNPPKF